MEENKKYSIVGKVEIGTDEYRDLIEGLHKAKTEAEKNSSRYYEEYRKANSLESDLKTATAVMEEYKAFINSSELIKAEYIKYRSEKECPTL